ncbi:MAG: DegV family protein [Firmicutes bacterium]|nr:DegV family protein [Bacillota bacterium]
MTEQKIGILCDSGANLSAEMRAEHQIEVVPLQINFSDRSYADGVDLGPDEIYSLMEKELPKSSLPKTGDIYAALDALKARGCTEILFITISSGLSGCFQLASMLAAEYSGPPVTVFDSKTLSCGEQILVLEAAKAVEEGCSMQETVDRVASLRKKTSAFMVLKTLEYLAKGGRIGKVAGTVGSLLHLCPVITVNEDGVYDTVNKTIGFGRAVDLMVQEAAKKFHGKNIAVSIVHAKNELGARAALQKLRMLCCIQQTTILPVSAVLGIHTGAGLIGMVIHEV